MNAPENHTRPGDDTARVWKWKIARQWRNYRTAAIVQIVALLVGIAILISMLGIPNPTSIDVVLRLLCAALLAWAAWFLFGPYRATKKNDRP